MGFRISDEWASGVDCDSSASRYEYDRTVRVSIWLNRDPIGERGGVNLYGMVGNQLINAIDPLGMTGQSNTGGDPFASVDTQFPGPHARESAPIRPVVDFSKAERKAINDIGNKHGCHSCGTKKAGTKTGNWIPDHQPPRNNNPDRASFRAYPR
ncbi:MAG: hypothetical protein AAFW82_07200, partial [Pseudomonadota bacterium]